MVVAGIVSAIIGTGIAISLKDSPTNTPNIPPSVLTPPPSSASLPEMIEPKTLHITQRGIETPIQAVGLDANGNMATPANETDVGWYSGGVAPGNIGPAVLAAHTGLPEKPTTFRRFEELKKGSTFSISDVSGQTARFEVIDTAVYTPESAPRELIFGSTSARRVTLITCIGTWMPHQKTYSHRLVIYAMRSA